MPTLRGTAAPAVSLPATASARDPCIARDHHRRPKMAAFDAVRCHQQLVWLRGSAAVAGEATDLPGICGGGEAKTALYTGASEGLRCVMCAVSVRGPPPTGWQVEPPDLRALSLPGGRRDEAGGSSGAIYVELQNQV